MEDKKCALVSVEVSLRVEQSYHYLIPPFLEAKIEVGSKVLVPFGKNRTVLGYVLALENPPLDFEGELKEIVELKDAMPFFSEKQLELARWLSEYSFTSLYTVLKTLLKKPRPTVLKKEKHYFPAVLQEEPNWNRALKQKKAWELLLESPGLTKKKLAIMADVGAGVIDSMLKKGLIFFKEEAFKEDYSSFRPELKEGDLVLTSDQRKVFERLEEAFEERLPKVFLLQGVTGSGKTEIYLRLIKKTLEQKRQAIYLVPEISLTLYLVEKCKQYFGDKIAVLHSRLLEKEKYDEWEKIRTGRARLILGTRSAILAPVEDLGLIILDEEHDQSYKQDYTFKKEEANYYYSYDAKDVALKLASLHKALVVLGSATPSLESYNRALTGTYNLLCMPNRVLGKSLPFVKIVDMIKEARKGNSSIFSEELLKGIENRLVKKEQIILFLNRRGYSTSVICRECGLVLKCPHCDISLTYHNGEKLVCHYCNYVFYFKGICPDCKSKYLDFSGMGTQKVEEEIKAYFPYASVLRMDGDTAKKGAYEQILTDFKEGKADILLGTQMIAKGLDLPKVTLVGVINADSSLYFPDFRASERTFQLLTQVAGRAGRGDLAGEVLIQTFSPEHYSIKWAKEQDYPKFFQEEMEIRKNMGYPPFVRLARVLFWGKEEKAVFALSKELNDFLQKQALEDISLLGPAPAPLSRGQDRYRYHLLIKAKSGASLRRLLKRIKEEFKARKRGVFLVIDMDPQNLM